MKVIMLFLLSVLVFIEPAEANTYNSKCINHVLNSLSPSEKKNHSYLSEYNVIVSYTDYDGEKTQEVFAETGRVFTDVHQDNFLCTPTSLNPERSLAQHIKNIFSMAYQQQISPEKKREFIDRSFPDCNRSDFSALKIEMSKLRSQVQVGRNSDLSGSIRD